MKIHDPAVLSICTLALQPASEALEQLQATNQVDEVRAYGVSVELPGRRKIARQIGKHNIRCATLALRKTDFPPTMIVLDQGNKGRIGGDRFDFPSHTLGPITVFIGGHLLSLLAAAMSALEGEAVHMCASDPKRIPPNIDRI